MRDITNSELPDFTQRVRGARTDVAGVIDFEVRGSRSYVIERDEAQSRGKERTQVFTAHEATKELTLMLVSRAGK